ncbi:MAG TPA: C25 family cysteine peptidase [Candidatus Polarisedimenticolia bacterium]|nr:C25 family cysteine peptidase [Candidatus Polarisedimenticolia bacterium]
MNSPILRPLVFVGLLLCLVVPGHGAPGSQSVPLSLGTPELRFRAVEGGLVPALDGFGTTSRPGEPALPVRIVLVAIPEGAVPSLAILRADSRTLTDLDVPPVPTPRLSDREGFDPGDGQTPPGGDRRARGQVVQDFARSAPVYGADAFQPDAPLHLGRVGALRDQAFVEVIWTPLLYDPVRREGRLYGDIEAVVTFDLPAGQGLSAAPPADPHFEAGYRSAFINYEQGRFFRRQRGPRKEDREAVGSTPVGTVAASTEAVTTAAAPAGPRFKIAVSKRGLYRLDLAYLNANAAALLATDPRTWGLEVDGVEVPISILNAAGGSGEADGVFGSGDTLEFFGLPKTEPPTLLNFDMGLANPSVYEANDFTDTQVYWLTTGTNQGGHKRIPSASGAPVSGFAQAADFEDTATWEENNIFIPLGAEDPYFSIPSLLAGSAQAQRDLSLALPGLAPAAVPVTVTARLRGGSSLAAAPDHRTRVWLNSDTVNASEYTWDDETMNEHTFSVPRASVSNPLTVHALAVTDAGISVDRQYPDWFKVKYRRTFTATGDVLLFTVPNQNGRYQVGGLGATAPRILEVGRTVAGNGEADAVALTGATPSGAPTSAWTFEAALDASAPATRTFAVVGPSGALLPDAMTQAADPVLKIAGQQADFIVIGTTQTIDPAPGGSLDLLLGHRLATQGLHSRVVFIDQVYDEFSFGRRDANAVRSFLAYAFANWRGASGLEAPPSFALLVGDATPDFKNVMQRADWVDQVPTPILFQAASIIGYYSSDNWLASVSGSDQIPDLHLGRISTRSVAASAAVFDKIRQFETTPPSGTWKGRAILTAGDGKFTGESDDFEAVNNDLTTDFFSQAPYSHPSPQLYFDNPPWNAADAAGFKTTLLSELQSGAAVLTFVGHGNFEQWGLDAFFTTSDAVALTNGLRLPFMVNVNCLSGGFHYLVGTGSLGEGMVNNPAGGAIAALAPSGLSNAFVGSVVSDDTFLSLFGPDRETVLGEAALPMRTALWQQGSIVDLQGYTFLGDPASRIATPAPAPPTALQAQAGNGQVTLSWTPPGTPAASTRLYRATGTPGAASTAIACTPAGANSCIDSTVINASRYYYFAVSVDADGFEGANSNFNSDCDAGPDCVTARPINPNPPSVPTGLVVRDAGTGGRLDVSWNKNPETDIKRYTVRYGITAGAPTATVTAAATATGLSLFGLQTGTRYYVSLTATNTSDIESARTAEVSEVPHLFEGIAPPRAIDDLTVNRSGSDLVLTWTRPAVDIYGRPTYVVGYRVYRGTTPNFTINPAAPFAVINSGTPATWTHTGGYTLAGNAYYVVTAVDSNGLVSGAGRDLPNGVGSLDVTMPASAVHLSWLPVTTDVQGLPTLIDHYQVHVTSAPVSRAGLGPSTLFMDNVTATSVDLVSLPAGTKFISVLAVDNRGNLSPF